MVYQTMIKVEYKYTYLSPLTQNIPGNPGKRAFVVPKPWIEQNRRYTISETVWKIISLH